MPNSSWKKRVTSGILALTLLASLAACGTKQVSDASGSTAAATQATVSEQSTAGDKVAEVKDPFGKYEPGITITTGKKTRPNIKFAPGEDYDNNIWMTEYKNQLGITVKADWMVDESQYENKVNLSIASGDIPDTFVTVTPQQEQQLVDAGLVADISDIFDQYASPILQKMVKGDPNLYKRVLTNGKLYSIPMMPSVDFKTNVLYIRKDWLEKVNLPAPKTVDELWKVIEAFAKNDPDGDGKADTMGIGFNKELTDDTGIGDIGPMFNIFKAYPHIWIKDASGKLVYGSVQPEMKAALQKMQDMYKQGLIDKEFTVKDQGKVSQDIVSEKLGVEFGVFWSPANPMQDLKNANPKSDWVALDIPSIDGTPAKSNVKLIAVQKLVISKDCKNPEAVIKMVNLAEENLYGSGERTTAWYRDVQENPKYKDLNSLHLYPVFAVEPPAFNYQLMKEVTAAVDAKNADSAPTMEAKFESKGVLDYLQNGTITNWFWWKLRYGPESGTGVSNARQDEGALMFDEFYGMPGPAGTEKNATLIKLEREAMTKIIMGAAPVSDFDKFVETWKSSGGNDVEKEINEWYEKNK
jgi:putative aldouronate transport system substrate-binding protein